MVTIDIRDCHARKENGVWVLIAEASNVRLTHGPIRLRVKGHRTTVEFVYTHADTYGGGGEEEPEVSGWWYNAQGATHKLLLIND